MIYDSNKSKEYLIQVDGDWKHVEGIFQEPLGDGRIEIPEDADCFVVWDKPFQCAFYKDDLKKIIIIKGLPTEFRVWESCPTMNLEHISRCNGFIVWKREKIQDLADKIKPVKSDGGSSSYYFTALPEDLIKDIVKRGGIEIKDIVRYCFDNDADCKDIIKALKRIRENLKGGGKEGVDNIYDANKICFFAEELRSSLKVSINK